MPRPYTIAVKDKRTFVRQMFARIAPHYDLANRLMTFGLDQRWRKRAAQIALAYGGPDPHLLDLGTGTGDMANMVAALNPHARVVGLDLTREMMELAVTKLRTGGTSHMPGLVNGDTLDLPFPASTFDAITSAFVLRNLVALDRAFCEMVRVAKPGARIVALEITRPRQPIWSALYRLYFYRAASVVGGIVSGDFAAYRYLPYSLSVFVSAEELGAIMTRAGIRDLKFVLLNLGTVAIHFGIK
jgi:demethylmenaquinone methyltransferase/2-methoxy-6-polyprenyl-1,4-benzoquinol methylase